MGSVQWLDRAAWGARPDLPQLGHEVPHEQFVGLVIHHDVVVLADLDRDGLVAGDLDDIAAHMRDLQTVRPDLGLDVPYSFVVAPGPTSDDAVVCEGRGWGRTGAHTAGMNSTRYGIAFAGDYTTTPPTAGMVAAVRWLGATLADPTGAQITLGHRQTYATACPGDAAYPLLVHMQPPFGAPAPIPDPPPTEEDAVKSFQIVSDDGNIHTFIAGQPAINMGGLPTVHGVLHRAGIAELINAGAPVPAAEIQAFAARWNA